MREGYCSRPVCLSVCLSVYPSVPAFAASASANNGTHGFLLGFSCVEFRKNLPFKSYGVEKPICKCVGAHRQPLSRSFETNETQQLREGQLVGLQRLATGATGVKQARYRRKPTRGSEALARACAVYTTLV